MSFLPNPIEYSQKSFHDYVNTLSFNEGFYPQFPIVGSTTSLRKFKTSDKKAYITSLNTRDISLGKYSGTHLVVSPTGIWNLSDLQKPGHYSKCWKRLSIGVAMVGNFDVNGEDFLSGDGAKVKDLTVFTLAVLFKKLNWSFNFLLGSSGLHFRKDCPLDANRTPGNLVNKANLNMEIRKMVKMI